MTFNFMMEVTMCWLMALCILACAGASLVASYQVWLQEKNVLGKIEESVPLFVLGILCLLVTLLFFCMPWYMELT